MVMMALGEVMKMVVDAHYWTRGTVLSALQSLFQLIFYNNPIRKLLFSPILEKRKLRHSVVKSLARATRLEAKELDTQ